MDFKTNKIQITSFTVDFFTNIDYNKVEIGGVDMNKFEQDPQSKANDVVGAIKGFTFSFIFFVLIFTIGTVISVANL